MSRPRLKSKRMKNNPGTPKKGDYHSPYPRKLNSKHYSDIYVSRDSEGAYVRYEMFWTRFSPDQIKGMKNNDIKKKFLETYNQYKIHNPTPKKGDSKILTMRSPRGIIRQKMYFIGRTQYSNKKIQISQKIRDMGIQVTIGGNTNDGYMIWASKFVDIPMMEVGGDNLFMEGEYNPKKYHYCDYCGKTITGKAYKARVSGLMYHKSCYRKDIHDVKHAKLIGPAYEMKSGKIYYGDNPKSRYIFNTYHDSKEDAIAALGAHGFKHTSDGFYINKRHVIATVFLQHSGRGAGRWCVINVGEGKYYNPKKSSSKKICYLCGGTMKKVSSGGTGRAHTIGPMMGGKTPEKWYCKFCDKTTEV